MGLHNVLTNFVNSKTVVTEVGGKHTGAPLIQMERLAIWDVTMDCGSVASLRSRGTAENHHVCP